MSERVALVTGGIGELGRSICERLTRQGYRVAALDIALTTNGDDGRSWQARLAKEGNDVLLVAGDVTDFESCTKAVARAESELGPVDILVNCAGITRDASLRKLDKEWWDAVLATNLDSVFNVTKQVIDGMTRRGFGRIVNISSLNGVKGQFGQTNYSAAKAGMHGFTMALAREVARNGVTVNTVSPGVHEHEDGRGGAAADPRSHRGRDSRRTPRRNPRDSGARGLPVLGRGLVHHRRELQHQRRAPHALTAGASPRAGAGGSGERFPVRVDAGTQRQPPRAAAFGGDA